MWAAILNQPEIQRDNGLRIGMLNEATLNFEEVYHSVLESSDFSPYQKELLSSAIGRVYSEMDQILCQQRRVEATASRNIIGHFGGSADKRTRFLL